jgi:hypothetical protein
LVAHKSTTKNTGYLNGLVNVFATSSLTGRSVRVGISSAKLKANVFTLLKRTVIAGLGCNMLLVNKDILTIVSTRTYDGNKPIAKAVVKPLNLTDKSG